MGREACRSPILLVDIEYSGFVVFACDLRERIQRPYGQQRYLQPVAQTFGERDAYAQSGIGAGALAHGHGIEILGRDARFAQQLVCEDAQLTRVVATAVALSERYQLAVFGDAHGANVRAGFNTQYE